MNSLERTREIVASELEKVAEIIRKQLADESNSVQGKVFETYMRNFSLIYIAESIND